MTLSEAKLFLLLCCVAFSNSGVIVPLSVLVLIVTFYYCYAECSDTGVSHFYCFVEWACDECHTFLTVMLSAVILHGIILKVIMLSVIILNVVMLSVILLNVALLSVITLNIVMLTVGILNVVMPNAVMMSVVLMNVIILSVVILNVVMTSVMAP